jgi:hypothetical protein
MIPRIPSSSSVVVPLPLPLPLVLLPGQLLPGQLPPDLPGPLASLEVESMNERDAAARQSRRDRLEAEGRGFGFVFGA